jgi:hypothetical protein
MNTEFKYWTWEHNIKGCLRNGSFVRKSKNGLAQYMNGDFMGFIEAVPAGMTGVDDVAAFKLIPQCCK